MDFRLLGPLEVVDGGEPVRLAGGKPRALLALLLLNANRTVGRDRIVDELWGEGVPESAAKMVQIHVSQLRKALPEPRLVTRASGYLLEVADDELDAARFERLVAGGREALAGGDAEAAAARFAGGLALWRGPALAEFPEPFARQEGARLEELRTAAVEGRVEAELALGRHADVVGELEALVARHPLRERLRAQHMLALYRSGRHAEALAAYQDFRRMLGEELGMEPPPAVRELQGRMLRQDPALELAPPAAAGTAPAAPGRPPRASAPAGRARELMRLEQLRGEADAWQRRVVFVTGDAGIGKTTVVEWFARSTAKADGSLVARGQCVEHRGAGEPYLPVLEAVGRLLREPGGAPLLRSFAQHAPTWVAQMPSLMDDDELAAVQRRVTGATHARMLREMLEALDAITGEALVVLVLEDLHWSDPSTVDLLEAIARRPDPARLLLLGTYRRGEAVAAGHSIHRLLQTLRPRGLAAEIALGGLDEDDLDAYAAGLHGGGVPAGLGHLLHDRTGGNPLFAKTLLDAWREGGLLGPDADLDRLARDVPDSIRDLIEQMLDQLEEADRALVEAASVAGRGFSAASVAAALELDIADVEARCTALAHAGRFLTGCGEERWPDGTISSCFRFRHDLLREVVYERLPAARRVRLHGRIGRRLAEAHGEAARESLGELADHLVRAGDAARAVPALRLAAEQAFERHAAREALGHLTTGLEMLAHAGEGGDRLADEFALQSMLGAALIATRGWSDPGAEAAFLRAREIAEQIGRPDELGATLFRLAALYEVRGEYERSDPLLQASLGLSGEAASSSVQIDAHELLACSHFHQGSFQRALDHAERGLGVYDGQYVNPLTAAYGDNAGASCHSWAALALWFLGFPDRAAERARQAVELTDDPRRRHGRAFALVQAAAVAQCRGEPEEALAQAEAAQRVAAEDGYAYRFATATVLRGWAIAAAGGAAEGVTELERGLALSAATGARMDDPYYLGLLADARLRAGRHAAAAEALDGALAAAGNGREFFYEAEIHRLRGAVALAGPAGAAEALRHVARGLDVAGRQGARSLQLRCALSAAPLLVAAGEAELARVQVEAAYAGFSEGFETPDLIAARDFLAAGADQRAPRPARGTRGA